jgi:hypothetical protein
LRFTYRSARSGAFALGISAAILIETVAIHLLIVTRIPVLAYSLTILSVLGIVWIVRDYTALGSGAVVVTDETIQFTVGRRFDTSVSRANIARALQPTFRDLPTPGTNQGRDYLNMTKPASPNVLIVLKEPASVRLAGGLSRQVRRLSLHLDDPTGFLALLG